MSLRDGKWGIIPKIGEGISSAIQGAIRWIAKLGINITPLQSKILLIIVLGGLVYLFLKVIDIGRKLLKWGLIILFILLILSIISSMI